MVKQKKKSKSKKMSLKELNSEMYGIFEDYETLEELKKDVVCIFKVGKSGVKMIFEG